MKSNTTKIFYWIITGLFAAFMLMDGIGGLMRAEAGQEVMQHLGYPVYILTIFGVLKLLGAVAILQNRLKVIKEWAYAGFAFNFVGAAASRAFVGDDAGMIIFPAGCLAFMFLSYYLWKRVDAEVKRTVTLAVER